MSSTLFEPDPFALFCDPEEFFCFCEKSIESHFIGPGKMNQACYSDFLLPFRSSVNPPFPFQSLINMSYDPLEDLLKYADHIVSDSYGEQQREYIHTIYSKFKGSLILLLYYTLCYLFQDQSRFLYTDCLCHRPSIPHVSSFAGSSPAKPTWSAMKSMPGTAPCYTIKDTKHKKNRSGNESRNIASFFDSSCDSIAKPLCKITYDNNFPNNYFLTQFQYPVSLAVAELDCAKLSYDSISAKLSVSKPAKKKSNLKEVISTLYSFYREVCFSCLEKRSSASNLMNYFKLEYGLGITTLVQSIDIMKNECILGQTKSYDPEKIKEILLCLQKHPAVIEKDNLLSEPKDGISCYGISFFGDTGIKNFIKIARMTLSILFDLFYPEIYHFALPSKWSPAALIDLLGGYIDSKLNSAFVQSFSTAPMNIPTDIYPWMHIVGRIRLLVERDTDKQAKEIAGPTISQLSEKCKGYIITEVNELMHAISDLSEVQIQILCDCILARYSASWWEDIHSLFSLN